MSAFNIRRATHANSWYSGDKEELRSELSSWLGDATPEGSVNNPVALIAPHAGYSYSGPTAAYAYSHIKPHGISNIFVLGPSHHYYLEGVAISKARVYETPLGNLNVNHQLSAEVKSKLGRLCEVMDRSSDEEEHSLEMHLPFIAHVMGGVDGYTITPLLVGNLNPSNEKAVGQVLAEYIQREDTLFVISSDFCHWGSRFRYQYYDEADGPIYKSIEKLDKRGMNVIESKSPEAFTAYLKEYQNTICGNHPISVMLNALKASNINYNIQFVKYAQSSHCKSMRDSSVSYASAIVTRE